MWERTLQDLIRGLRANKGDEAKFIAQALDEIRQEVKGKDMELKAGAILKLTYLNMLGYDMDWASFHVVEVMSSPRAHLKAVGYLAAAQSFKQDTDVLMLTTNLLKKDLGSAPTDVATALDGLSHIVTPDLARDLSRDLIAMLNHSRPHIRKRAVLVMYKIFKKYPDTLEAAFPRIREKLDDSDAGVVSATVNMLCELSRKDPQRLLPLAPQLFHILTTSANNWTLIKVIKLFGSLAPHEPRLVKKLQSPITQLISTTPAISLLYECVRTCIISGILQGSSGHAIARTCVEKLAAFLEDQDQNLKYIALLALVKIVPSHPHLVATYQNVILSSVDDVDISIRMRALDVITVMVTHDNLQPIVQHLLAHLVGSDNPNASLPSATQSLVQSATASSRTTSSPTLSPAYRLEVSKRILSMCSRSTYENVTDFEWYFSVLVDLAYVASVDIGKELRDQMIDVAVRVRDARNYAVKLMVKLLSDDSFLMNAGEEGSCAEVLWAAAWIVGEYPSELTDPQRVLTYLLQPSISTLSQDIISGYLLSSLKVFGFWAAEIARRWDDDFLPEVVKVVDMTISALGPFVSHQEIEIQERAANGLQLFAFIRADLNHYRPHSKPSPPLDVNGFEDAPLPSDPAFPKSLYLVRPLTSSYELNAVAASAQASVPIPDGLDLEAWIVPSEKALQVQILEFVDEGDAPKKVKKGKGKERADGSQKKGVKKRRKDIETEELVHETPEERAEREKRRAERLERLRDDPYYISDDRPNAASRAERLDDVDSIPIVKLDDIPSPNALPLTSRMLSSRPMPRASQPMLVDRGGEMPPGAISPSVTAAGTPSPQPALEQSGLGSIPPPFQPYEVEEERVSSTPEPIKVTRVKKKATSKKKKAKEEGVTL